MPLLIDGNKKKAIFNIYNTEYIFLLILGKFKDPYCSYYYQLDNSIELIRGQPSLLTKEFIYRAQDL